MKRLYVHCLLVLHDLIQTWSPFFLSQKSSDCKFYYYTSSVGLQYVKQILVGIQDLLDETNAPQPVQIEVNRLYIQVSGLWDCGNKLEYKSSSSCWDLRRTLAEGENSGEGGSCPGLWQSAPFVLGSNREAKLSPFRQLLPSY
ncbi:unnamed protein product [Cuscuta epithymum]|uniref:Uncharacterized protein n=1 Tax=Cuscuta epithymum TaxID=186058 RepID=A0AAV0CVU7_9ASTE|nr:unnamed protein product [Cuscuta epithymum]